MTISPPETRISLILRLRNPADLAACMTRGDGAAPMDFKTTPGDARILNFYRRRNDKTSDEPSNTNEATQESSQDDPMAWQKLWIERIQKELSGPITPDQSSQWMQNHGFIEVSDQPLTLEIAQRLHPQLTQDALNRDRLASFVHGVLTCDLPESDLSDADRNSIEVYCVFNQDGRMAFLHVGPRNLTP